METMKTHPIYRSKKYEANIKRLGERGNSCICCGLATAENLFIHASTAWVAVDTAEDFPESQGSFPVGPECAKKFPKEFIFSTIAKAVDFTKDQKKRILARRIEIAVSAGECIEQYLFLHEDSFDFEKMLKKCNDNSEFGFEV